MVKAYKEDAVKEIRTKFESAKTAVFADYRGLTVAEMTELRSNLRKSGVELKVYKNTLTWIAVQDMNIDEIKSQLVGPTIIAFDANDAVAPAKLLVEFAKTHKKLIIKAGVVEGKVIDAAGVNALATLPSREVLIAKALGSMMAPLNGLAGVLAAVPRSLVLALDSVRKQKENAA